MPKAIAQVEARPDTKRALVEATAELIAEVGWGRVSSRMVAERAGVNNALVHYHFGSMENLLRSAAEQVVTQEFAAPAREIWRGRDVVTGMGRALRWLRRLDVDAVETMVLVESLVQTRRDPVLRNAAAGGLSALRAELSRAIAAGDGRLRGAGPEGVATVLLALLDGLLLHRVVDPGLELGAAARSLKFLLAGDEPTEVHR